MKREQPIRGCSIRAFSSFLVAVGCLTAGCGSRHTELRTNGTIDLGGGVKMEFVLVQPGSFKMGSKSPDPTEHSDEEPVHEVTLTKPFYLGKYEVTQKQWLRVLKNNPSDYEGPDLPVEDVSWEDAQTFLKKLRKMTGENFALPTEAQWEYACRAGTDARYSWGDRAEEAPDYAWFGDDSGYATHPVGEKKPNAWGLYDMSGNVWEWCADTYGPYPSGEVTDPLASSSGKYHVARGGNMNSPAAGMHCANRNSDWRGWRSFGLRCAIVPDKPAP